MTKSEFARNLKAYKELKDFFDSIYTDKWEKLDHFSIDNGVITFYYFAGGTPCQRTFSYDEMDNKIIFDELDEDIMF